MRRTLHAHQVHLWYLRTEELAAHVDKAGRDVVSSRDLVESIRFATIELRDAFLLRRAFLRTVLSQYDDVAPRAWEFRRDRLGKPEIAQPLASPKLQFSMSKTAGLVACAIATDRSVGVDAETVSALVDTDDISQRFFASSECASLSALPEIERRRKVFELWTLKEAYSKARGLGLRQPFEKIAFSLTEEGRRQIVFADPSIDEPRNWVFVTSRPNDRDLLALAIARQPTEEPATWHDTIEVTTICFEGSVDRLLPRPTSCTKMNRALVQMISGVEVE